MRVAASPRTTNQAIDPSRCSLATATRTATNAEAWKFSTSSKSLDRSAHSCATQATLAPHGTASPPTITGESAVRAASPSLIPPALTKRAFVGGRVAYAKPGVVLGSRLHHLCEPLVHQLLIQLAARLAEISVTWALAAEWRRPKPLGPLGPF